MSDLIIAQPELLPVVSRVAVRVRVETMGDLAFIDSLQKKQAKQVGFFPTKAIEGKVAAGQVLLAETLNSERKTVNEDGASPVHCLPFTVQRFPVGYLIGQDQYFKRDDVGVVYQINVIPEMRRSLVAASLLKAQFERSAYGCKLYCCWCAQDIEANRFWESMGFVPLAFRSGSERKARVHIFWQTRIGQGDVTTPLWFPSKTAGGAIGEDRIVLPIPPGVSWRDEMPRVLPKGEGARIEDGGSRIAKSRSSSSRSSILDLRPSAPTPRAHARLSAARVSSGLRSRKRPLAASQSRNLPSYGLPNPQSEIQIPQSITPPSPAGESIPARSACRPCLPPCRSIAATGLRS